MILYVGASLYHVLCFSIHKILYRPEEEAILVIGDNIFSKSGMPQLKQDIEKTNLFSRVVVLKFIEGAYTNPYRIKPSSPKEQIERYIAYNEIWVEDWLEKVKISIEEITEFNSAIDHRHLGLYLLSKQIPYQYFEDGNGLLSREEVQMEFHKKAQYASYAVVQHLHALGNNEVVTKKYANAGAQVDGFHDEKMEDFHVIHLFESLSQKDQRLLLQMFHAKRLSLPVGSRPILYLTRYVKYLQNPTMEHHRFLSSMILDLFAQGAPVIIKPHPRDFSGQYREMFPDAVVLPKQFPSELLPFIYEGKYEKIITTGSTAIDALSEYSKERWKLDIEFEQKFYAIYSYVAAVQFIKYLFPEIQPEEIGVSGCCMELLNPLCRQFLGFEISKDRGRESIYQIMLVDEIKEHQDWTLNAKSVCYLNTLWDFRFADGYSDIFEHLFYLNVSVRKRSEAAVGEEKESALFVQTDDKEIAEKLEYFYFKHTFWRSGMVMFLGNDTKERQEYMKIWAEIFWIKCSEEREKEHWEIPQIPRLRRRISQKDMEAMSQRLIAVKKRRREKNESYGVGSDEIKE